MLQWLLITDTFLKTGMDDVRRMEKILAICLVIFATVKLSFH